MRTSELLDAKNCGFFEMYGVSVRTDKGVEPVRTFFGKRGGVNFSRFCVDVLYGRPLRAAPGKHLLLNNFFESRTAI